MARWSNAEVAGSNLGTCTEAFKVFLLNQVHVHDGEVGWLAGDVEALRGEECNVAPKGPRLGA